MTMTRTLCTLAIALFLVGCTSNEEKMQRIVDAELERCLEAEGPFYDVRLQDGTDEILVDACSGEVVEARQTDEFHGVARVGPYDWLFGNDPDTGVWVLTSVSWEPMEDARKALAGQEPTPEARERAEKALGEAQEVFPDNGWIRMTRVENALALREETRKKDKETPAELAEAAEVYETNLAWARENDKELAARMQLALIDHFEGYQRRVTSAVEGLGSQDDWFEAAIRDQLKEGNKEEAAKYQDDLDKMREKRPEDRARLYERLGKIFESVCGAVSGLTTDGVEDSDLTEMIETKKSSIDCSPEARPQNPDEEAD